MDTDQAAGAAGVTVAEAARVLGCSERTIRRKIKGGELAAVKVARPQGAVWYVQVNGHESGAVQAAGPRPDKSDGRAVEALADLLEAERARSVSLERERAELYGRVGYLQAELEGARERLKLLDAPPAAPVEPAATTPRRSWQFWRR